MSKVHPDAESALQGLLKNGMTIAAGGFGLCGIPEKLIRALVDSGVQDVRGYPVPVGIILFNNMPSRSCRPIGTTPFKWNNRILVRRYNSVINFDPPGNR